MTHRALLEGARGAREGKTLICRNPSVTNCIVWSVAIALGITCILLIACLGGTTAYYVSLIVNKNNQIDSLNSQIADQNSTISSSRTQISQLEFNVMTLQTWLDGNGTLLNQTQTNNANLQKQIDSMNSDITNLQNQANNLHIATTENSTVWVHNENAGTYENVVVVGWAGNVPYAGYISVRVSSTNNSTYVALFHASNGIFISDYQITVGFGGTVVFPVSPTPMLGIFLGNSVGSAVPTMTITYYY